MTDQRFTIRSLGRSRWGVLDRGKVFEEHLTYAAALNRMNALNKDIPQ